MDKKPLISIILTTFNRAHLIGVTLDSVIAQTYKNWECLIVDDNSVDSTFNVVCKYLEKDIRFSYILKEKAIKKGLPASRNIGLKKAKGTYIIFFDDDDFIHPMNLELCIHVFKENEVDFCHYAKKPFLDGESPNIENTPLTIKQNITLENIEAIITQKIGLASCTVMWKLECFKENYFNEDLMYAEEWECYSRIISQGYHGVQISNVLYYNRKHIASNTGQFYQKNPIQRRAKKDAVLLVFQNLLSTKLMTENLLLYFMKMSVSFKEFNLFNELFFYKKSNKLEWLHWRCQYLFYSFLEKYNGLKKIIKTFLPKKD